MLTFEPQFVTIVASEEPNSMDDNARVDESSSKGSDVLEIAPVPEVTDLNTYKF